MLLLVPSYVHDEINRRLDVEIAKHPAAGKDREALYGILLGHFNDTGVVPEFTLAKKEA